MLVDPRLVGEGVAPHHRLVVLHRVPGEPGHEARGVVELGGVDPQLDPEGILAGLDRHDDLLDRGVAGPLADPVDGTLDLAGPGVRSPTASWPPPDPRSLWQWTEMITSSRSPLTSLNTRRISSTKSAGVANPTVSGMLMVVAPASTARRHTAIMNSGSERVASWGENSTSSV